MLYNFLSFSVAQISVLREELRVYDAQTTHL